LPTKTGARTILKHLTARILGHWPTTRLILRGDSHYGRAEAMEWAENNGVGYIFGLAGNTALGARVAEVVEELRFHHARSSEEKLRTYTSFMYQARSWAKPRRVVARIEVSLQPDAKEDGQRSILLAHVYPFGAFAHG
jgi:hypothetical protein